MADLPSVDPLAAERLAACRVLLSNVQRIESAHGKGMEGLARIRDALAEFAQAQASLFPDSDFAMPVAHMRFHTLVEGGDTPYGLYYSVNLPGKEAAPHVHGLWCATTAFCGSESNRFWRRVDDGSVENQAKLVETHAVSVQPGAAMAMADHDIHSTLTVGSGPTRMLHLYARPFAEFPPVVYFNMEFGTWRRLPQVGRTILGT